MIFCDTLQIWNSPNATPTTRFTRFCWTTLEIIVLFLWNLVIITTFTRVGRNWNSSTNWEYDSVVNELIYFRILWSNVSRGIELYFWNQISAVPVKCLSDRWMDACMKLKLNRVKNFSNVKRNILSKFVHLCFCISVSPYLIVPLWLSLYIFPFLLLIFTKNSSKAYP